MFTIRPIVFENVDFKELRKYMYMYNIQLQGCFI